MPEYNLSKPEDLARLLLSMPEHIRAGWVKIYEREKPELLKQARESAGELRKPQQRLSE